MAMSVGEQAATSLNEFLFCCRPSLSVNSGIGDYQALIL